MRKQLAELACAALLLGCSQSTVDTDPDGDAAGGSAGQGGAGVAGTNAGNTSAGGTNAGGTSAGGTNAGNSAGGTSAAGTNAGGSGSGAPGGSDAGGMGGSAVGGSGSGAAGPVDREREREELERRISDLAGLDAASLRARFPTAFAPAPRYEPSAVAGLDTIQASRLSLSEVELQALSERGFVVSETSVFPTFAYGYSTIYSEDLPVYISADSILYGVHRSFDRVLQELEVVLLTPELSVLLSGMRSRLASGVGAELGDAARADADTFLAVAASLLEGSTSEPVAGGSRDQIASLVASATAASGPGEVDLFGAARPEDFSQYKPRGHYTYSEALGRYFRAMMWLGRIDFRLIETQKDGSRVFQRSALDGMLLMNELVDAELRARFERIDRVVRLFVGEPDYMELSEVAPLLAGVGASSLARAAGVDDTTWQQAIVEGGYGLQRISSHIMVNGLGAGTLPLSLSFALLGQRYVIDSHVFSNVVYDRAGGGSVTRMLPNPLDVAFAVLGNDQAAELLAPELETHAYAPDLAAMRLLADRHPPEFWGDTLYNLWLGALRELSPARIAASVDAAALPPTFRSEAWGRRLLVTELASWAELRHDTLLYAKQSYTGGGQCEFPDGYVDPYPEFYAKLAEYAERGAATVAAVSEGTTVASRATDYFNNLRTIAIRLRDMATHQRTGAPYTQEMLDFLNDAVYAHNGCGSPVFASGWYRSLFYSVQDGVTWAPTIADVHTQPMDLAGNPVGKVLHVGTGDARYMVVIAETCSGPRAYAGLASSYYELVTEDFYRYDDPTWERVVREEPEVPWAADLTPQ
jgi:hypothetical protein